MTRNEDLRNGLPMKQLGCVLLLLLVTSFPSIPVLLCARRFLRLLNISIKQLTQLALGVFAPERQIDAISRALMCICREALAVAHLRRTLAHIHLAEFEVLVGIHSTVTVAEEVRPLQLVTFRDNLLLAVETVLRPLRMDGWISRASSQSTHTPALGELPNLIIRHVDAGSRCQVIAPDVVVVTAEPAQLVLVADWRLDLEEIVAIPSQFDAKMRLDNHFVVAALVNLDDFLDDMRQHDARSIHFYAQLLAEVDFDVGHFKGDCLRPARVLRLTCVVRHANRECVVDAVGRQLILARTLEAEKLSVEGLVVRIAEHGAHGGTLDALRAALAVRHDEILVRSTLDLWALGLCAANFAGATLTRLTWAEIPCLVVLRNEDLLLCNVNSKLMVNPT